MKSVVLLGGKGTRLRPLTYDRPKPLVPICGKPFMEYQLDLMKRFGIKEVIFSLGYKSELFERYFGDGSKFGMRIKYVVEKTPLGTGGAIKNVEDLLDDEPFYVFNGDILSCFNLEEIAKIHIKNNAVVTIAITPVDNPENYGVVEIDSENRIINFIEKPQLKDIKSNFINAGLYIMDRKVLNRMKTNVNYSIERQIFPYLLSNGESMFSYRYNGYWMDIGNPYKYLSANLDILMGKLNLDANTSENGFISPDADIHDSVKLHKPIWIGKQVTIGDNSEIYGPAIIGDRCKIGCNVKIYNSLLWEDSDLGDFSMFKDCIIGRYCHIENNVAVGGLSVIASNMTVESGTSIQEEVYL